MIWVIRDLSNSDGKRYVWWFETQEEAQAQIWLHEESPCFARLGKPMRWTRKHLEKWYQPITGCIKPNYWEKRGKAKDSSESGSATVP